MYEQLKSRLTTAEDAFVERKLESTNDREIRKELVAFANSVPDNSNAVLFIGVADNGDIIGVSNADEKQKKIRKIAEQDCYPPISIQMYVVPFEEKRVVAIVVPPSQEKPHFSGQAYFRVGSESKVASRVQYEDLINSRNNVCREILNNKASVFTVRVINKKLGIHKSDSRTYTATHECRVVECNQHSIRLYDISLQQYFAEPLENILVLRDEEKHRPMLIVSCKRA